MHPVTTGDVLLAEIRDLLRDVRDRLPEQPSPDREPGPVEVRGVDAPATPPTKKAPAKKAPAKRTRKKQ